MNKCSVCQGPLQPAWNFCPSCGQAYSARPFQGALEAQGGIYGGQSGSNCTLGSGNASIGEPNAVLRRPGLKLDEHKAQVWTGAFMSFPNALEDIARKTIEGCGEPGHVLHGWKEVPDGYRRYTEAFARHVLQEGKVRDPVEAHDFMVTTTWNSLARLEHHHLERARSCSTPKG